MEQYIEGNRYDYIVKLIGDVVFEVTAIRKNDGKKSAITNLNSIIGEIIYPIVNTIYIENTYLNVVDFQKGKKLFDSAIDSLNGTYWVNNFLEKDLDEDFNNYYNEITNKNEQLQLFD